MATYKILDGAFLGQKTLQRCSTSNSTRVCSHENGQKRAERCPAPLLPHHQQAEEMGWCMWRDCDVVSVSEPPWYHTLRWKTSQTVLAHHSSNYQQQECLFISITSFFFSSSCMPFLFISAPGSFTSAHLQHFPPNLPSQQPSFPSFFFFLLNPLCHSVVTHSQSDKRNVQFSRPG